MDGQRVEITVKPVASPKPWREGLRRWAGSFAVDWTEEDDRVMEAIYQERKTFNGIGRRQREATTW